VIRITLRTVDQLLSFSRRVKLTPVSAIAELALHVGSALFNGFSFWMVGNRYADLQNRLFTIFQFIFVARSPIPPLYLSVPHP
jgi:hypothetical protein